MYQRITKKFYQRDDVLPGVSFRRSAALLTRPTFSLVNYVRQVRKYNVGSKKLLTQMQ